MISGAISRYGFAIFGRQTRPMRQDIPPTFVSDEVIPPPTLMSSEEIPPTLISDDDMPPSSLVSDDDMPPPIRRKELDRQPILPLHIEKVKLVNLIADVVREIGVWNMRRDDGGNDPLPEIFCVEA